MSTRGQFNTKNPTIKRILKEASELVSNPSLDFHAEPLEDNLFEWHFTLCGPPSPSPYAGGIYHGRIILPSTYPLRPPSFRFVTASGRFEVNREICLSISGHHEETWQPAWGIRTALVAIRSFMDTDAKGQVGGLECSEPARKKMASDSASFKCGTCRKTNKEIMAERAEAAKEMGSKGKEGVVPEELRLAYRDELNKGKENAKNDPDQKAESSQQSKAQESQALKPDSQPSAQNGTASSSSPNPVVVVQPSRTTPIVTRQATVQHDAGIPSWIDKAIYGLAALLIYMVLRKIF
ncbi:UBC-like protein [Patellaria atrata CBS 101060]|uniref:UBC-like protein n=1 Tax=Patellaria atrata CBS 101060 TaxID=1346257 RepID=A0A9P4S921_9PEZI|nr:UBC-like protein [Patellaria atrata CBS 101060]